MLRLRWTLVTVLFFVCFAGGCGDCQIPLIVGCFICCGVGGFGELVLCDLLSGVLGWLLCIEVPGDCVGV